MNVPPSTEKIWKDILQGKVKYEFEFLTVKILLGRLMSVIERDPSPATIQSCVDQLYNLFEKTATYPTCKRDLQKILGN